jgi:hypothetical protein
MNTTNLDAAALSKRSELNLAEDNVAALMARGQLFLPESVKIGQHPGTQSAPKPKQGGISAALARAHKQLDDSLAAQATAQIGIARSEMQGGSGGEAHVAAARARVDFAKDLIAGLELLAKAQS